MSTANDVFPVAYTLVYLIPDASPIQLTWVGSLKYAVSLGFKPNWPYSFEPQAHKLPDVSTANVWFLPDATLSNESLYHW